MDMDHFLDAPGGGVQARLTPGYQSLNALEHRGQGPRHTSNHSMVQLFQLRRPLQEKRSTWGLYGASR